MQPLTGSLLAIISAASFGNGAGRLDELFDSWDRAQRSVRSLVVEFTVNADREVQRRADQEVQRSGSG